MPRGAPLPNAIAGWERWPRRKASPDPNPIPNPYPDPNPNPNLNPNPNPDVRLGEVAKDKGFASPETLRRAKDMWCAASPKRRGAVATPTNPGPIPQTIFGRCGRVGRPPHFKYGRAKDIAALPKTGARSFTRGRAPYTRSHVAAGLFTGRSFSPAARWST